MRKRFPPPRHRYKSDNVFQWTWFRRDGISSYIYSNAIYLNVENEEGMNSLRNEWERWKYNVKMILSKALFLKQAPRAVFSRVYFLRLNQFSVELVGHQIGRVRNGSSPQIAKSVWILTGQCEGNLSSDWFSGCGLLILIKIFFGSNYKQKSFPIIKTFSQSQLNPTSYNQKW